MVLMVFQSKTVQRSVCTSVPMLMRVNINFLQLREHRSNTQHTYPLSQRSDENYRDLTGGINTISWWVYNWSNRHGAAVDGLLFRSCQRAESAAFTPAVTPEKPELWSSGSQIILPPVCLYFKIRITFRVLCSAMGAKSLKVGLEKLHVMCSLLTSSSFFFFFLLGFKV